MGRNVPYIIFDPREQLHVALQEVDASFISGEIPSSTAPISRRNLVRTELPDSHSERSSQRSSRTTWWGAAVSGRRGVMVGLCLGGNDGVILGPLPRCWSGSLKLASLTAGLVCRSRRIRPRRVRHWLEGRTGSGTWPVRCECAGGSGIPMCALFLFGRDDARAAYYRPRLHRHPFGAAIGVCPTASLRLCLWRAHSHTPD
jgi:hypothetical protein